MVFCRRHPPLAYFLASVFGLAGAEGDGISDYWAEWLAPQAPLEVEWVGEVEWEGIKMRRLRYTGSVWEGKPQRVYALYSFPEGEGPFPAILQIHGGGQTCFPENLDFFVKHGYACLSFDWTGPRDDRPKEEITNWHEDFRGGYLDPEEHLPGQSLVHHAVLAAIRGIDVLCEQPEVDPNRIGVQGISWGGYLTWLVGGLDTRVRASVPVYGAGGLEEQWSGIGATIKARSGEFRDYWRSNYDPASFATVQRGPLMYLNSTNDFFGQLTQAEQRLENVAVEHRRNYSPNQNHGLDPEAVAAGMAWFDAHLKETGQFPEEPRIELGLAEGGEIQATLHIDESRKVQEVRVDFSRGGRPDLLRCWISSEATRVEGGVWRARIPLVETVQPLALIPQVRYHEGFTLSGPLRELVPAIEFQKSKSSEQSTDIVSDWNNGPAGWFLPQGTDFFHADKATPHLTSGTLESRAALIFKAESVGGRVHLATRLLVDPLRNEGNRRALEFWTHDLKNGEIRTDWWTSQPGVIPCRASFEGGPGWRRNVIRLEDLSLITENSATPEGTVIPLGLWNDVQRLDIVADAIQDGTAAIGLMRWVEPSGGGFSLLTTPPDPQ